MSGGQPPPRSKDATDRVIDALTAGSATHVEGYTALTPEQKRARDRRNLILALSIAAFVVLVFTITVVRLKAGILDRPL